MSINTLLEAVEYVENVDTTTTEQNAVSSEITTTADIHISNHENGIIKHWRKRAVAQSVKELNNNATTNSHFTESRMVDGESTFLHLGSSIQKVDNLTELNADTSVGVKILNDLSQNKTIEVIENSIALQPYTDVSLPDDDVLDEHDNVSPTDNKTNFVADDPNFVKQKSKLGAGTREAHNILEKSRRAYLKECFEMLRKTLPTLGSKKISNLIVLREALKYVQMLKRKGKKQEHEMDVLAREKIVKVEALTRLRRKLSEHLDTAQIENILKLPSAYEVEQQHKEIGPNVTERNIFAPKSLSRSATVSTNSLSNTTTAAGKVGSVMAHQIEMGASSRRCLVSTSHNSFSMHEQITRLNFCNTIQANGVMSALLSQADPKMMGITASVKTHILPQTTKLSQISAKSSATVPSIEAISATSHKIPSVRTYHGRGAGFTSIIGGCPNQMKIVVKPVDSAKQQARAVKSSEAHKGSNDGTGHMGQVQRQTDFVFRPRSSLTPPPPSRITPYFPRFSVGSGGSPPLTEVVPDINESSLEIAKDEHEISSKSKFSVWRSRADGTEQFDSKKIYKKKHSLSIDEQSHPLKILKMSLGTVHNTYANLQEKSLVYSKPRLDSETDSETETTLLQTNKSTAPASILLPKSLPASGVLYPPTRRQNKSVTQVCYSTLKATKPTVLPSPSTLPSRNQTSQDQPSNSIESENQVSVKPLATKPKSISQTLSNYQTQMPFVGYQVAQPGVMGSAALTAQSSASGTTTSSISLSCLPTISPAFNIQQGIMSSSCSNVGNTVTGVPQVQYLMPIGYPGMMANTGEGPVAFQQTMGGFIPMMPQGQSWGYVLPQQMVLAPNNDNNTSNISISGAKVSTVTSPVNVCMSSSQQNVSKLNPPEQQSSICQSNPLIQANVVPMQSYMQKTETPLTVTSMPHVQFVTPNYQPGGSFMVPMATGQGGGFIIGGTPTMISPSQGVANDGQMQQGGNIRYQVPMNIVGYPLQMGGASTIQLAPLQNTLKIPQGFSLGFSGGIPTQVLNIVDNQANTSISSENIKDGTWSA